MSLFWSWWWRCWQWWKWWNHRGWGGYDEFVLVLMTMAMMAMTKSPRMRRTLTMALIMQTTSATPSTTTVTKQRQLALEFSLKLCDKTSQEPETLFLVFLFCLFVFLRHRSDQMSQESQGFKATLCVEILKWRSLSQSQVKTWLDRFVHRKNCWDVKVFT